MAVILEVAGLVLLAGAAFMVATVLGVLVTGAECLLAGVVLDVIEILPRLRRPKTDGGG